jgi:hypothetical protein
MRPEAARSIGHITGYACQVREGLSLGLSMAGVGPGSFIGTDFEETSGTQAAISLPSFVDSEI